MRNKWYVLAIAVPAVLLAYWAVSLVLSDNAAIALLPAALAAALFVGAYRVARSAAFTPEPQSQWPVARSPGVTRWLKDHADAEAPAAPPVAAPPALPTAKG